MSTTPLVYVVDDDAHMSTLLSRVLAPSGMQVKCFGSAADLLSDGDLNTGTVLLLDLRMPEMSGKELHQLLLHRGVDLPLLFISGSADLATAVAAMRNGAADFIEKPVQSSLLIECVRRASARHASRMSVSHRKVDPLFLNRLETLTPKEREVFNLLVTGLTSKLIARKLGGSFRTIESHRAQIMRKMTAWHLPDLLRMSVESTGSRLMAICRLCHRPTGHLSPCAYGWRASWVFTKVGWRLLTRSNAFRQTARGWSPPPQPRTAHIQATAATSPYITTLVPLIASFEAEWMAVHRLLDKG